jgi:hypothetical protein
MPDVFILAIPMLASGMKNEYFPHELASKEAKSHGNNFYRDGNDSGYRTQASTTQGLSHQIGERDCQLLLVCRLQTPEREAGSMAT